MKKGFTLVELLAVIILLGVLGLIATVSVSGTLKDSRQKLCESQLESFIEAAETYTAGNIHLLPGENGQTNITIKELQTAGLLDDEIINPKNDEEFDYENTIVTVKKSGNSFKYTVDTNLCK